MHEIKKAVKRKRRVRTQPAKRKRWNNEAMRPDQDALSVAGTTDHYDIQDITSEAANASLIG